MARSTKTWLSASALALLAGCYTADLDPERSGVFACEIDDDCPANFVCGPGVCASPEDLPTVELLSPSGDIALDQFNGFLEVRLETTLELQGADAEPAIGAGFIEVFVRTQQFGEDEVVQRTTIESPDDLTLSFTLENSSGIPVRIAAQAFASEGIRYPNAEARAQRLLFLDDGTPQVGIVSPWPDQRFPTEETSTDFTMRAINIDLFPPTKCEDPMMRSPIVTEAHGHLFQQAPDQSPLPGSCFTGDGCRNGPYQLVAPPEGPVDEVTARDVQLNAYPAGQQLIVVSLQDHCHFLFLQPSDSRPVIDAIPIRRSADVQD